MDKSKIVLLHGACNTSNFGDVLFVKMFYQSVKAHGDIPTFVSNGIYRISDFNIKEINNSYKSELIKLEKLESIKKADMLLFISGGYFGDNERSIIASFRRWFRYFYIGLYFVIRKKDIYILGVGGAPLYSWFNRMSAKIIMNHAQKVYVRDEDTAIYFRSIGVKNQAIRVTADTALTITAKSIPELIESQALNDFINGRQSILLHLTGSTESDESINRVIVPGIIRFLATNMNTCIILSYDNVIRKSIENTSVFQSLKSFDPYVYNYISATQLCSLINQADIVITSKLHVGIIGCALGKSVLSFPMHRYKTKRFYQSIGYENRCVNFSETNEDVVYEMLVKYHDIPVIVTEDIRRMALENLEY